MLKQTSNVCISIVLFYVNVINPGITRVVRKITFLRRYSHEKRLFASLLNCGTSLDFSITPANSLQYSVLYWQRLEMEHLFALFSMYELRVVIRFWYIKNTAPSDIHFQLCKVYGENDHTIRSYNYDHIIRTQMVQRARRETYRRSWRTAGCVCIRTTLVRTPSMSQPISSTKLDMILSYIGIAPPSDYHLFHETKKKLDGRRFAIEEKLNKEVFWLPSRRGGRVL